MSEASSDLYNFVMRGTLTEEALDRAGRKNLSTLGMDEAEVGTILSIDLLDATLVEDARKMATVYTAVAAFENAVRELMRGVLLEGKGEGWWSTCVSEKIRQRAEKRKEDEEKTRWHAQRGTDPIYYTTMADLVNIMRNNFDLFEPYVRSIDWVASVFDAIERSRNVIMHSGSLDRGDIERVGIHIRDWIKQVGS